jgi:caa(3)-type oxidase subunit IV
VKTYFLIFGALAVCTAISFLVNEGERHQLIGAYVGFAMIFAVAVCKAVLVGMFFMHLKLDWTRLYFVIVPVMILAVMLLMVLLPDIVLAWRRAEEHRDTRSRFAPAEQFAEKRFPCDEFIFSPSFGCF